jgi:spermidine/putrescine transport system permease protein
MRTKTKAPIVYLALITAINYLPILVVVAFSFNASKLPTTWTSFSLRWYGKLASNTRILESLRNSLILGLSSTLLSAIIGTLGALGLAKTDYKTNKLVSFLATLPLMIPEIILGMVYLAYFSLFSIPFGFPTLLLAHTSFCVPYIMMMVSARLVGMDENLEEAARDLGASRARAFRDITLPLLSPAILSGSILAFAMSFDDIVISVFVNSPYFNTLPTRIYTQMKTGVTPEINALCTLMLLVTLSGILLSFAIIHKKRKQSPS